LKKGSRASRPKQERRVWGEKGREAKEKLKRKVGKASTLERHCLWSKVSPRGNACCSKLQKNRVTKKKGEASFNVSKGGGMSEGGKGFKKRYL